MENLSVKETLDNIIVIITIDELRQFHTPLRKFLPIWAKNIVQFKEMTLSEFKTQWACGTISAYDFFKTGTPFGDTIKISEALTEIAEIIYL